MRAALASSSVAVVPTMPARQIVRLRRRNVPTVKRRPRYDGSTVALCRERGQRWRLSWASRCRTERPLLCKRPVMADVGAHAETA